MDKALGNGESGEDDAFRLTSFFVWQPKMEMIERAEGPRIHKEFQQRTSSKSSTSGTRAANKIRAAVLEIKGRLATLEKKIESSGDAFEKTFEGSRYRFPIIAVDFDKEIVGTVDFVERGIAQIQVLNLRSLETETSFIIPGSWAYARQILIMDKLMIFGRRDEDGVSYLDVYNWEDQRKSQTLNRGLGEVEFILDAVHYDRRLAATVDEYRRIKVWQSDGAAFEVCFTFQSGDERRWQAICMDSQQVLGLQFDKDRHGTQTNFSVHSFSLRDGTETRVIPGMDPGFADILDLFKQFSLIRFRDDADDDDVEFVDLCHPLERPLVGVKRRWNKWKIVGRQKKFLSIPALDDYRYWQSDRVLKPARAGAVPGTPCEVLRSAKKVGNLETTTTTTTVPLPHRQPCIAKLEHEAAGNPGVARIPVGWIRAERIYQLETDNYTFVALFKRDGKIVLSVKDLF